MRIFSFPFYWTMSSLSSSSMKKAALYSFQDARRMARNHGFESRQEFLDYSCPGAYQLPKNPEDVWKEDWKGWDDWLGIPYRFSEGREIARSMAISSEEAYLQLFKDKQIHDDDRASRLPYRPDLKYKSEWKGWNDWLGI